MRIYLSILAFVACCCLPAAGQSFQPRPVKDKAKDRAKDKEKTRTFPDEKKTDKTDDKFAPTTPAYKDDGKEMHGGKTRLEWEKDLTSKEPDVRALAILNLVPFQSITHETIKKIIARLGETGDVSPRAKACLALRVMTIPDDQVPAVIEALAKRLSKHSGSSGTRVEQESIIRYEAAVTLRRFVEDIPKQDNARYATIVDALLSGMVDRSSWEIRHTCIGTLWRTVAFDAKGDGAATKKAIDSLAERYYKGKDVMVYQEKLELIIGLGWLGQPKDEQLHAKVVKVLHDQTVALNGDNSKKVFALKLWAYAGLVNQYKDEKSAKSSLAKIAGYLDAKWDIEIRMQAAAALGFLHKKSKAHASDLLRVALASDTPENLLGASVSSVIQISGEGDQKVIDMLMSLMTKEKDISRAAVGVMGLATMNANKREVLEAMEKMRKDEKLDIKLRGLIEAAEKHLKAPKKDAKGENLKAPKKDVKGEKK